MPRSKWILKTRMENQDCFLFSVQSSFILVIKMYTDKCNNSCLNLQSVRFKPETFSFLWRICFWFELENIPMGLNWKFQKEMNLSFICPTWQQVYLVNLAYPYSGYKIESRHLSPFLLPSGQVWKGNGFINIFSEELKLSNFVLTLYKN